jgi:hypothetical protein
MSTIIVKWVFTEPVEKKRARSLQPFLILSSPRQLQLPLWEFSGAGVIEQGSKGCRCEEVEAEAKEGWGHAVLLSCVRSLVVFLLLAGGICSQSQRGGQGEFLEHAG